MIRGFISSEVFSQWRYDSVGLVSGRFVSESLLQSYGGSLRYVAVGSDGIQRVYIVYIYNRLNVRSAITPPLLPSVGWLQKSNAGLPSVDELDELVRFFREQGFHRVKFDLPPEWCRREFNMRTSLVKEKYTYRLRVDRTDDELLLAFHSKTRNIVRSASRDNLRAEITHDSPDFVGIMSGHFYRSGLKAQWPFMERLLSNPEQSSWFGVEVFQGAQLAWTGVFLIEDDITYYLAGARNPEVRTNAANTFGVWSAMRLTRDRGCTEFDFEGSMIPSVERFIAGFGGEKHIYNSIQASSSWIKWIFRSK